tara:strand:- start:4108 stop:4719 length:612 start_codon:yes stop_codon:yes gene_type:complete
MKIKDQFLESKLKHSEKYWKSLFQNLEKSLEFKKYIGEKHLDFGCEFGTFANLLSKKYKGSKILGLDLDKKTISIGKRVYRRNNLKLKSGGKITGKYNSISCILVIHEIVGGLNKILKELYNKLDNEGKILIYDFRKSSIKDFRILHDKNPNPKKPPFKIHYKEHNKWNLTQFENIMKKVGFKTLKLKPIKKNFLVYVGEKRR